MTITLDDQIRCVRRELQLRENLYPGFVRRGKLKPAEADHQLAAMRAVLSTLEAVARDRKFVLEP